MSKDQINVLNRICSAETLNSFPWQVHIRVASPPIKFPCYMGINIPTKEELIANKPEFLNIAGYIGKYRHAGVCLCSACLTVNSKSRLTLELSCRC